MLQSLKRLFTPDPLKQSAHDAYVHIVTQARQPVFYKDWHVPDTLDGRFDVIVLHLFLVLAVHEKEKDFCRHLTELFFADMDRSLREMGASDTGVGIRVKNMAQAFYGRLAAYAETIDNETLLGEAIVRNVWREKPVGAEDAAALAGYMQRNRNPVARVSVSTGSYEICWDPAQSLRASQD